MALVVVVVVVVVVVFAHTVLCNEIVRLPLFTSLPNPVDYVIEKTTFPLSKAFFCAAAPAEQVKIEFFVSKSDGPLKQLITSPSEGVNILGSGKLVLSGLTLHKIKKMQEERQWLHCKASIDSFTILSAPFTLRIAYIRPFEPFFDANKLIKFFKGNVAQVTCRMPESSPSAVPIFKINGSRVLPEERIMIVKLASDNHYALLIKNVKVSDQGKYTCSAMNPQTLKIVDNKQETIVSVETPLNDIHPTFLFKPDPINHVMYEGENATFTCIATSAPVAHVKFQRAIEQRDMMSAPRKINFSESQFGLMTIQRATVADSGRYLCRIIYRRKDGTRINPLTASFNIIVKKRLRIVQGPTDAQVGSDGNGVSYNCRASVDDNEQSTIMPRWYINGARVTSENMHGVRLEGSRLVIFQPRKSYYGVIQCVIAKQPIWLSQHATLSGTGDTILLGKEAIKPSKQEATSTKKHQVDHDTTALLKCELSSKIDINQIRIIWMLEGRILAEASANKLPENRLNIRGGKYQAISYYLQVARVSKDDEGNYTCQVRTISNDRLLLTNKILLLVGKPAIKTKPLISQTFTTVKPQDANKPSQVISNASDITSALKHLDCIIDRPLISWKYVEMAIDVAWHVNSTKTSILYEIENFLIYYKMRRILKTDSSQSNIWQEPKLYLIVSNQYFGIQSFDTPKMEDMKYTFNYTLQNNARIKHLKPQHEYQVQIKYAIENRHFRSPWSKPLRFDRLLEMPPPKIISVSPKTHGISWQLLNYTVEPTSFIILTRTLDVNRNPTGRNKQYTVNDPTARKYYFHDLEEGKIYEIRMYAEASNDKRTDLSDQEYIVPEALSNGQSVKIVVPATDENNTLLFSIVGSLVVLLISIGLIMTVICCINQQRYNRRMRALTCRVSSSTAHMIPYHKLKIRRFGEYYSPVVYSSASTFKDAGKVVLCENLLQDSNKLSTGVNGMGHIDGRFSLKFNGNGGNGNETLTVATTDLKPFISEANSVQYPISLKQHQEIETSFFHDDYLEHDYYNKLSGGFPHVVRRQQQQQQQHQHELFNSQIYSVNSSGSYSLGDYYGNCTLNRESKNADLPHNSDEEIGSGVNVVVGGGGGGQKIVFHRKSNSSGGMFQPTYSNTLNYSFQKQPHQHNYKMNESCDTVQTANQPPQESSQLNVTYYRQRQQHKLRHQQDNNLNMVQYNDATHRDSKVFGNEEKDSLPRNGHSSDLDITYETLPEESVYKYSANILPDNRQYQQRYPSSQESGRKIRTSFRQHSSTWNPQNISSSTTTTPCGQKLRSFAVYTSEGGDILTKQSNPLLEKSQRMRNFAGYTASETQA